MSSNVGVGGTDAGLVNYTHIVYALHALSVVVGVVGASTVVGAFVFGLPSIVAVIMNYVRRSETRGTWLESHFRWQIRTFWYAFGWAVAIAIVGLVQLPLLGLGIVTWMVGFLALAVWIVYRVARGWLALKDGRAMPVAA